MLDYLKKRLFKFLTKKVLLWIGGIIAGLSPVVLAILAAIPIFAMVIFLLLGGSHKGWEDQQATTGEMDGVSIPEGCMKHSDTIKSELKRQGLSEKHLNVMLAICAQESGGSVADIFQSSESLGQPPNSIGPAESIKAGIKHYKAVITQANAKEIGSDNWKTALQAYNMGGGFIDYVNSHGGKFSPALASAFSQKMQDAMGVSGYGDVDYVEHVMKYLSSSSAGSLDAKSIGSPVDPKLLSRVSCKIGSYSGHPGIDIVLDEGTSVFSMTDGTVTATETRFTTGGGDQSFFGRDNHITIKTKENPSIYITYRHMKSGGVLVKEGQAVKAGQKIALSGNTGFSTGAHLHVEVLKNNVYSISNAIDWYTPLAKKFNVQPGAYSCGI